jgi:restriction system protein
MSGAYYSKRYGYNDNYYGPTPKSRRSGPSFTTVLRSMARVAREAERDRRANERHKIQVANGLARLNQSIARENDRNAKMHARAEAQQHVNNRLAEVEHLNATITDRISEFEGVLQHTLSIDDTISFDQLRKTPPFPEFNPDRGIEPAPLRPLHSSYLAKVTRPFGFLMIFGFIKNSYERKTEAATSAFNSDLQIYQMKMAERQKRIALLQQKHDAQKEDYLKTAAENSAKVNQFEELYRAGEVDSVRDYCSMVLDRSEYPEGLEQDFDAQFEQESRTLKVTYSLPNREVISPVATVSYVKSRDAIVEKMRRKTEINSLYSRLVSSIALRTLHELFEADQCNHLASVEFAGTVEAVNPETGKPEVKVAVQLRASKSDFSQINLASIDPVECLNGLGGALIVPSR